MRFGRLTLRRKLVLILLVTTTVGLVVATAVSLLVNNLTARRDLEFDVEAQARVAAENSTGALAFEDADDAASVLRTLGANPDVLRACLYARSGPPFAEFTRPGSQPCPHAAEPTGPRFDGDSLHVVVPVEVEGRRLGTLSVQHSLRGFHRRLGWQAVVALAALVCALLVASVVSARLQRVIADPILHLADTARAVSTRRDYGIRATRSGEDELALLVDAFNEMLEQIQQRDTDLQRAKDMLEHRVAERTDELRQQLVERHRAEEMLEQRNVELTRSNQDLDDFAHIASHDLREPLRGIQNYAIFLSEDYADQLDEAGKTKLETLRRLSQRMEDLIGTLLHYSRVGRSNLAFDQVDLNVVVDDVLDSLGISLAEQRVQVQVERPLPTVWCDRARIGEVFRNLITNAMKYNDKPEKRIVIGSSGTGDGRLAFFVRDNGLGIPEKHFESVFRIFKRLHPRDQYGGGTGAGLTIVRKIVERHNGQVWVESTVGQGTTFYFTLSEEASDARPDRKPAYSAG
jgi:signal transduction histidine kinase